MLPRQINAANILMNKPITFIDLFCGCGGFSLGLERAGLRGLVAVDFNKEAVQVFQANFKSIPHILEKDLTEFSPVAMEKLIGTIEVDLIVGGPPCQGFSTARQVDGANHGDRLTDDPRRHLYKEFLKYVMHFKPKVFVMENVLGIRSVSGGIYFSKVQAEARKLGYRVHSQLEECVKLGLPQKRRRQLFIGTRLDQAGYFNPQLQPAHPEVIGATLGDAIGDLPKLKAGQGEEIRDYDLALRERHCKDGLNVSAHYLDKVLQVSQATALTAHRARPQSERDLGDFLLLKEGESSAAAMRNGVKFAFPYDKTSFKDRYTRQHRKRPCSTIVAHLAKDGLMFIHPTQNRSITAREAARIQSFPDWFQFPLARTHQFRVIGNAVPPLVSEAIGNAVISYLSKSSQSSNLIQFDLSPFPKDEIEAVRWLEEILKLNSKQLKSAPTDQFLKGWYAVGFLYAGLHPDGALDHGSKKSHNSKDYPLITSLNPLLANPYYVRSGWPVSLTTVAAEAWRRYDGQELKDEQFYCSEAQMAGICQRDLRVAESVLASRKNAAS